MNQGNKQWTLHAEMKSESPLINLVEVGSKSSQVVPLLEINETLGNMEVSILTCK